MHRMTFVGMFLAVCASEAWSQNPYYRPQQLARPAAYDPSPTVSPYLNLAPLVDSNGQFRYIDGAYQTYVRPQLQQRQAFQQQQMQISQLRTRLNHVQQAPTTGRSQRTGHVSRFQSFTHFYPQLARSVDSPTGPQR